MQLKLDTSQNKKYWFDNIQNSVIYLKNLITK